MFDEIEKAHRKRTTCCCRSWKRDISLTPKAKVDFRNAIIVMTSNISADMIKRQSSLGFTLAPMRQKERSLRHAQEADGLAEARLPPGSSTGWITSSSSARCPRAYPPDLSLRSRKWLNAWWRIDHPQSLRCALDKLRKKATTRYGARPLRRVIRRKWKTR